MIISKWTLDHVNPSVFHETPTRYLNLKGIFFYLFRLGLCFAFHLSNPSLVAAKTPRLKKKPPTNKNKIEPVYNPQRNPIAALTNSNITNTSHLSTNERWALSVLLIVFSNFRYITSRLNGTATNSVFFTSLFRYLKYAVFEIRCDDGSRHLSVRCSSFVDHH